MDFKACPHARTLSSRQAACCVSSVLLARVSSRHPRAGGPSFSISAGLQPSLTTGRAPQLVRLASIAEGDGGLDPRPLIAPTRSMGASWLYPAGFSSFAALVKCRRSKASLRRRKGAARASHDAKDEAVTPEGDGDADEGDEAEWPIYQAVRASVWSATNSALGAVLGEAWYKPVQETAAAMQEQAAAFQERAGAAAGAVGSAVVSAEASAGASRNEEAKASWAAVDGAFPEAPGMDAMNCCLHIAVPPQNSPAAKAQSTGVEQFMEQDLGELVVGMVTSYAKKYLEIDAVVTTVDAQQGLYKMRVPPLTYNLPLGTVITKEGLVNIYCSDTGTKEGDYTERGRVDLVLQDGEDMCLVKLGFPFFSDFSISAAGWGRTYIGWEGETVRLQADSEAGVKLMDVPGLWSFMECFIRSSFDSAARDCCTTLAAAADAQSREGLAH